MQNIIQFDGTVNMAITQWHTPLFTNIFTILTKTFDPKIFVIWFGLLLLGLWFSKKRYEAFLWGVVIFVGVVIKSLIKLIVARPRPLDHMLDVHTYSFPSGHATIGTIFFLGAFLLFALHIKSKWLRSLLFLGSVLGFVSVAFSRVYLHMHYLSDVVVGTCLGALVLFSTIWGMKKTKNNKIIKWLKK